MNFIVNIIKTPLSTVSGKFHTVHIVVKHCFILMAIYYIFFHFFHDMCGNLFCIFVIFLIVPNDHTGQYSCNINSPVGP